MRIVIRIKLPTTMPGMADERGRVGLLFLFSVGERVSVGECCQGNCGSQSCFSRFSAYYFSMIL